MTRNEIIRNAISALTDLKQSGVEYSDELDEFIDHLELDLKPSGDLQQIVGDVSRKTRKELIELQAISEHVQELEETSRYWSGSARKINSIDDKLAALQKRVDELTKNSDELFTSHHSKIANLDMRAAKIENKLEERLESLQEQIKMVAGGRRRLAELRQRLAPTIAKGRIYRGRGRRKIPAPADIKARAVQDVQRLRWATSYPAEIAMLERIEQELKTLR